MIVFVLILFLVTQGFSSEVCYDRYGCFSNDGPFLGIFTQLPTSPSGVHLKFRLFTRQTVAYNGELLDDIDTNQLNSSSFNQKASTVFIIHGYIEPEFGIGDWMLVMKDELLKFRDVNVVVVSWTGGNQFPYIQAAANTRIVGSMVSEFVSFVFNKTSASCDQIHVVGYSLGAHIAGYAGKKSSKRGCIFGRITGLDPAGPLFESDSPVVRLHANDATFVDVIHTDTRITSLGIVGSFGLERAIGDVDFYPNGGYHQPGCRDVTLDINVLQTIQDLVVCSHSRAVKYFTESINSDCQMQAFPCTNKWLFDNGKCSSCKEVGCQLMGFHAERTPRKFSVKYYLNTRPDIPFCGYQYLVTIYTSDYFRAGLESEIYITLTGTSGLQQDIELEQRDHVRGSSQSFVVLTKADLGDLLKIKISHTKYYVVWHLDHVTIKPSWPSRVQYTACVQSWLGLIYSSYEAILHKGSNACP